MQTEQHIVVHVPETKFCLSCYLAEAAIGVTVAIVGAVAGIYIRKWFKQRKGDN